MHPRLSMSEMCTYPLPFGDELALWDELGVRQVGLLTNNVDAFGRVAAIAALRERSMRATTVIATMFELSDPASWDATRAAFNDSIDLAAELGGCTYFTPGRRDGRSFDELAASLADAVALFNAGEVPTRELLGETFTLDTFEEAFAVMTRQVPGHDAVRVALRLT